MNCRLKVLITLHHRLGRSRRDLPQAFFPRTSFNFNFCNQVLGTFITEGGDGTDACQELFRSMESAVEAAKQLASIAAYFGFEGWLINVENCLGQEDVPHLLNFVRCGEGCDVCQW